MTTRKLDGRDASLLLSVVIPCFNEEDGVEELVRRVQSACTSVCAESQFEIILVNDGSKDRTWSEMQRMLQSTPTLVCVDLSRNHGHQLALTAGLSFARGERIFIIDADLQDPPELLGEMMRLVDDGADVVYGQRRKRPGETRFKLVTAALFYRALRKLTDTDIPADTGDFRLMTRRVMLELQNMPERQRFIRGMVAWLGFRQVPLLYDRAPRFAGSTKYPLRKMILFAVDAFTGFSIAPLRFSLLLALLGVMIAALLAGYSLYSFAIKRVVPGWASITFSIAAFSSLQLLMLGIIGEYLGRMFIESKQRPRFLVREILGGSSATAEPG
ncbi:MAG: glycosyltransferase family 2 protein [Gemmatimonadaceae bacterium]|nr:glycosyltransferase family 2 protein [Gemmatimonadaceae bacterium]